MARLHLAIPLLLWALGAASSGCFKAATSAGPDPETDAKSDGPGGSLTAIFRPTAAVAGGKGILLQVVVRDATGAPGAGRTVQLKADSGASVAPAQGVTDANGLLLAHVSTSKPGHVQVAVFVDKATRTVGTFFVKSCSTSLLALSQNIALTTSGTQGAGTAAGDLNGDGTVDLVTVENGNALVTLLNNGNGVFKVGSTVQSVIGLQLSQGAVLDLNGDGKADVVASATFDANSTIEGLDSNTTYYAFFAGDGDGALQPPMYKPISRGRRYADMLLTDLDGDRLPDFVTSEALNSNTVIVALNSGHGAFLTDAAATLVTSAQPLTPAAGDLNGDGWMDIVAGDALAGAMSIFLGLGANQFDTLQSLPLHAVTTDPNGASSQPFAGYIAVGDVTGDGFADIVAPSFSFPEFDVYTRNAAGQFEWGAAYPSTASYMVYPTLADFNGDGNLDVIMGAASLLLFLNQGAGVFGGATAIAVAGLPARRPVVADFNGDGALDVAVASVNQINIVLNNCQ